jgi:hypothetical protein
VKGGEGIEQGEGEEEVGEAEEGRKYRLAMITLKRE